MNSNLITLEESMTTIVSSNYSSVHLETLIEWFDNEWEGFGPFERITKGIKLPSPILAISEDKLQGGLAFSGYKNPRKETNALWINALLIEPTSRGCGIGSMLINAAVNVAKELGFTEIFVLTDKPKLYLKNGWYLIDTEKDNSVLGIILNADD